MARTTTFFIFIFTFITRFLTGINGEQVVHNRETLQIIIGGGGPSPPETVECPPPPPPPCPPPPPPPVLSPPPPKKPPPPSPKPTPRPSPKPSPKPKPKPPSPHRHPAPSLGGFESERLKLVYQVIQDFKLKVKYDPFGIKNTWTGSNICGYKGFVCDIVPKYNQKALAGVNFNNYNFNGPNLTLHDFLNKLPDITFFHANSNNFTGTIPEDINTKTLPYLYELDLSNNNFTGVFPTQVLNAKNLLFLDIRFNTFAGTVPPQVFFLNLDLLFINNNNYNQTLPSNLGSTTALYLTLANNMFIGGIPKSIGLANETLLEVLFLNNKLSGCLPYEIGLLKKSTVFDVGFNELTGPIPHSFQCLKKMELLNLAHNTFSGTVPEEVCSLPRLSNFTISYNYFTQVGPKCRKLIDEKVLNVKMNCILDLPNQRSPAECQAFFSKTHPSCVNDVTLTYVPCKEGLLGNQLESSDVQWTAPSLEPAQAPRGSGSYGALSPH